MLDGMMIFIPWPCRTLESSTFSNDGKGGFQILPITRGRVHKASFILAEIKPI